MKQPWFLLLLISLPALADKWDKDNDPRNFDDTYEYRLVALPTKATLPLPKMPWSSSYWPRNKGSINYRWNTPSPIGFKLNRPSSYAVRGMALEQLAQLSPAEKFDLAQGRYDYPLSKAVEKGSKKSAEDYEGVCDGWTAAAIQFTEPAPVTVKNPDGIEIPFGSSDVKALMSYDLSLNHPNGALGPVFVGSYCAIPGGLFLRTANCSDINPGSFHVILANQIGLKQESFAVDIDPGRETWNQPVYGFEFEITGRAKAKEGVAQAVTVTAKIMYAQDLLGEDVTGKIFTWHPTNGTEDYAAGYMEVEYVLEMDYAGRIIGGEWIGGSKKHHPDLFWMPTKKLQFSSEFSFLNQIYKPNL